MYLLNITIQWYQFNNCYVHKQVYLKIRAIVASLTMALRPPGNVKYDPDLMNTFWDLFKTLYIFIIFNFTCVYTIPIESLNFVWLILNLVRTRMK